VEFVNLGRVGLAAEPAAAHLAAHHHSQGRRVLIVARDPAQAERLDQVLWTFDPASFLPHALAGQPDQHQEPVLIATQPLNLNQAQVALFMAPPAEVPLDTFPHLVLLVPGQEGPELEACRQLYRHLKQEPGVDLRHTTRLPRGSPN